jgi:hypothetical protein
MGSHTVRVTATAPGGARLDRSWTFRVAGAPPSPIHLTISQPAAGAATGRSFMVRGNTVANARITITAGASPDATGEFSGTTTAGPLGNFGLRVNVTPLLGQQTLRVRVRAVDPVSSQSTQTTLQLRLNQ